MRSSVSANAHTTLFAHPGRRREQRRSTVTSIKGRIGQNLGDLQVATSAQQPPTAMPPQAHHPLRRIRSLVLVFSFFATRPPCLRTSFACSSSRAAAIVRVCLISTEEGVSEGAESHFQRLPYSPPRDSTKETASASQENRCRHLHCRLALQELVFASERHSPHCVAAVAVLGPRLPTVRRGEAASSHPPAAQPGL